MSPTAVQRKPIRGETLKAFLDGLTLLDGAHEPDGQMCVMEAVAFIAGEEWSDHPTCASKVISELLDRMLAVTA